MSKVHYLYQWRDPNISTHTDTGHTLGPAYTADCGVEVSEHDTTDYRLVTCKRCMRGRRHTFDSQAAHEAQLKAEEDEMNKIETRMLELIRTDEPWRVHKRTTRADREAVKALEGRGAVRFLAGAGWIANTDCNPIMRPQVREGLVEMLRILQCSGDLREGYPVGTQGKVEHSSGLDRIKPMIDDLLADGETSR